MKVLYIGQYTEGTTSKMRGEQIKSILQPKHFQAVDTNIPFYGMNRIPRSFGFRFKRGPLITKVNAFILSGLDELEGNIIYDLIWIDKGVFLKKRTVQELRKRAKRLVHFTPDMSFFENRSSHFENGMNFYDFLITTKKAEVSHYQKVVPSYRLIQTTQGFSKEIHFPSVPFDKKKDVIAFIGLAEKSRLKIAEHIVQNEIPLKVAGMGWEKFAKRHENNPFFQYYGRALYGQDYSHFISTAYFGLGLLSKNFPELHTTRTFEIPACGTTLLTERNEETSAFFDEDEVIFYSSPEEMIKRIDYYLKNKNELENLARKGFERVHKDGFDYESILEKILAQVLE